MNDHATTAPAPATAEARRPGVPWSKRLFDLCITIPLLVVFAPVMLVVSVAIALALGRPTLFRQVRPGLHGRPFTLVKFRSMTDARDASGRMKPDAERLPAFGQLLRRTSLDELPQLWNVLRGEMSLVGPRPLMMEYLPRYSAEQSRRHDVLPGITGWSQINGRNAASWPRRLALDVWYVDHQSLALDVKILALTIWTVFKSEGVNQPGRATVDAFLGTESPDSMEGQP
ncbi:MAG: sugar transferase [Chthoniobacter sp.]|nr:sugar transferase [Chthoniobacter sp.]